MRKSNFSNKKQPNQSFFGLFLYFSKSGFRKVWQLIGHAGNLDKLCVKKLIQFNELS